MHIHQEAADWDALKCVQFRLQKYHKYLMFQSLFKGNKHYAFEP